MNAQARHREYARLHAIKRARQRHGIRLSMCEVRALEERLRAHEGEVLRPLQDGCRVVRIRFLFDHIVVLFDPALDCIRTVLPRHCREWRHRPSERVETS
jgi:hypothetical protein